MAATLHSVELIETPDHSPDASWLEQEGFEERLAAYTAGDFYLVGVQARAEIHIPYGDAFIVSYVTSPGLWGIESDSDADYFEDVFREEQLVLRDMLGELGIEIPEHLSGG